MTDLEKIQAHYAHGSLVDTIADALAQMGKSPDSVTIDDLAPADEFHIGGRRATLDFVGQLGLTPASRVLDVGCGLGGPARVVAATFGCRVTGIDLTADYVEAARVLSRWVGLEARVSFDRGSALDLPYDDGAFDAAYMLHVGMNIADKARLAREVARVLVPGGVFGVYDVMLVGDPDLVYPVPWATTAETSALATVESYKAALTGAGFEIAAERNRHAFAVEFFDEMRKRVAAAGGPPPLGLHIVMGATAPTKVANMLANLTAGRIAPVELIGRRG